MKIQRVDKSYDLYRIEASFTEIDTIRKSLSGDSSGVVSDELRKAFDWYIERLAKPGEDEDPETPPKDTDELKPIPAEDDGLENGNEPEDVPDTEDKGEKSPDVNFDLDLTDLDQQLPAPSKQT